MYVVMLMNSRTIHFEMIKMICRISMSLSTTRKLNYDVVWVTALLEYIEITG